MANLSNGIVIEIETGPPDEATLMRRRQFDRNTAWLQANASEIYSKYRGQCICIAGEEVFAAATAREALEQAFAAHPDDTGRFVHYIPKKKVPRVYAH